ncbi:MAG: carboxypeptidase-like regulatory domain-containing protein, partial [Gemmatimonadales bacterium]
VVSTTVTLAAIPVLLDSVRIRERATGLRFSGIVVDDAGAPVSEAIVVAEGMDNRLQTDSSGHFRVNEARRGTLIIRVRKLGYAPYFGSFRFIGEREDTLRMARLGNTLPTVEVLERSGFGRDTFVFKDLDARMRWKSTKAGVISREELDQVGHVNLCEALYLTPTGSKLGIHQRPPTAGFQVAQLGCPDLPVCVILDGDRVVWQPLSRYMADKVESVEVFPPNSDISGTVAGRGCSADRQMAQQRVGSPSLQDPNPLAGPFVIWTRQVVPGATPAPKP